MNSNSAGGSFGISCSFGSLSADFKRSVCLCFTISDVPVVTVVEGFSLISFSSFGFSSLTRLCLNTAKIVHRGLHY